MEITPRFASEWLNATKFGPFIKTSSVAITTDRFRPRTIFGWDIVAFVQKLPTLSPEQYQAIVKSTAEGHDEMMKHEGTKD